MGIALASYAQALKKRFVGCWVLAALYKKVENYCELHGFTN